ncbi:MAG: DUF167 domain-containing protein [bacterium]|nr:DUF167 domain-containing protein [bacterium]
MRLTVYVKPGSKTEGFSLRDDGVLVVRIRAAAVDNKANESLTKLLAAKFNLPKRSVKLISGQLYRFKVFEIDGDLTNDEAVQLLLQHSCK